MRGSPRHQDRGPLRRSGTHQAGTRTVLWRGSQGGQQWLARDSLRPWVAVHLGVFHQQLAFWGLAQSFAFVRQPETNGVAERFNRTLKEQVFHGRVYRTIAEAREAVRKFVEMYNAEWLIEKNGLTSPLEHRRWFEEEAAKNRAA